MKLPENGVASYISGTVTTRIHLPAEKPICLYCWMLGHDSGLNRDWCRFTDEFILNPSKQRGALCPIKFDKEE